MFYDITFLTELCIHILIGVIIVLIIAIIIVMLLCILLLVNEARYYAPRILLPDYCVCLIISCEITLAAGRTPRALPSEIAPGRARTNRSRTNCERMQRAFRRKKMKIRAPFASFVRAPCSTSIRPGWNVRRSIGEHPRDVSCRVAINLSPRDICIMISLFP